MITGIGVDILHLARLRALITRRGAGRLAQRILSPAELHEFTALRGHGGNIAEEQTMFLGSRWAAKEALYKAVYPTHNLTWKEMHLSKDPSGRKPVLRVTPVPAVVDDDPRTRNTPVMDEAHDRIHVSLSHDADVVVAYVVVESVPW